MLGGGVGRERREHDAEMKRLRQVRKDYNKKLKAEKKATDAKKKGKK